MYPCVFIYVLFIHYIRAQGTGEPLVEARLSAARNLVAAFHSEACVMGEPLFKCGDRAEGGTTREPQGGGFN